MDNLITCTYLKPWKKLSRAAIKAQKIRKWVFWSKVNNEFNLELVKEFCKYKILNSASKKIFLEGDEKLVEKAFAIKISKSWWIFKFVKKEVSGAVFKHIYPKKKTLLANITLASKRLVDNYYCFILRGLSLIYLTFSYRLVRNPFELDYEFILNPLLFNPKKLYYFFINFYDYFLDFNLFYKFLIISLSSVTSFIEFFNIKCLFKHFILKNSIKDVTEDNYFAVSKLIPYFYSCCFLELVIKNINFCKFNTKFFGYFKANYSFFGLSILPFKHFTLTIDIFSFLLLFQQCEQLRMVKYNEYIVNHFFENKNFRYIFLAAFFDDCDFNHSFIAFTAAFGKALLKKKYWVYKSVQLCLTKVLVLDSNVLYIISNNFIVKFLYKIVSCALLSDLIIANFTLSFWKYIYLAMYRTVMSAGKQFDAFYLHHKDIWSIVRIVVRTEFDFLKFYNYFSRKTQAEFINNVHDKSIINYYFFLDLKNYINLDYVFYNNFIKDSLFFYKIISYLFCDYDSCFLFTTIYSFSLHEILQQQFYRYLEFFFDVFILFFDLTEIVNSRIFFGLDYIFWRIFNLGSSTEISLTNILANSGLDFVYFNRYISSWNLLRQLFLPTIMFNGSVNNFHSKFYYILIVLRDLSFKCIKLNSNLVLLFFFLDKNKVKLLKKKSIAHIKYFLISRLDLIWYQKYLNIVEKNDYIEDIF